MILCFLTSPWYFNLTPKNAEQRVITLPKFCFLSKMLSHITNQLMILNKSLCVLMWKLISEGLSSSNHRILMPACLTDFTTGKWQWLEKLFCVMVLLSLSLLSPSANFRISGFTGNLYKLVLTEIAFYVRLQFRDLLMNEKDGAFLWL